MATCDEWSHLTHDINHITRRIPEKRFLERSESLFVPYKSDEQHQAQEN
jgi:hypothetical protein